jgi:hypothetical protein
VDLVTLRGVLDNYITQSGFWRTNWSRFTTSFLNIDNWGGRESGVVEFDFSPFVNPRLYGRVERVLSELDDYLIVQATVRDEVKNAWEHPSNLYNPLGSGHSLIFDYQTLNPIWTPTSASDIPKFISLKGLRIYQSPSYVVPSLPERSEIERFIDFAFNVFIKPVLRKANVDYNLNLNV